MKILITFILLSTIISAQNTYSVQPGVKNNQIVLELSNISSTETVQITSLPNPSKGGAYERIKFAGETEKLVDLQPGERKEITFTFDVNYNIGNVEADTIEFMITDSKSIYLTKQFILEYSLPTEYKLEQNYPNPFNPTTRIRYQVSSIGQVSIKVYDILGNELAILVNEQKELGYYEVDFNAGNYASGVYVYRLQAGNYTAVKKMLMIK